MNRQSTRANDLKCRGTACRARLCRGGPLRPPKSRNDRHWRLADTSSGHKLPWLGLCLLLVGLGCSESPDAPAPSTDPTSATPHPLDQRPQPWERRSEPILSAATTRQPWSKVVLYSPHVLHREGKFKMWYLGTSTGSRSSDIALGYAESDDGIEWREHDANPILTGDDLPWGSNFQTPFVLFDEEEHIYKMWFVSVTEIERDESGKMTEMTQSVGYATSSDGIDWHIHPEPIFESGRSPSVIKEAPGRYRMWMGSRPSRQHPPRRSLSKHLRVHLNRRHPLGTLRSAGLAAHGQGELDRLSICPQRERHVLHVVRLPPRRRDLRDLLCDLAATAPTGTPTTTARPSLPPMVLKEADICSTAATPRHPPYSVSKTST